MTQPDPTARLKAVSSLVWGLASGLVWGLLLAGCEQSVPTPIDQSVRPAKLFQVNHEATALVHELVGRIEAAQTVDVAFEVDGTLQEISMREGQAVSKNTLVARLDPTDFQLAVREAEVQSRLAAQDLRRKEALLRDRGISESLVDDARANYDLSQVHLAQARERLTKTRITAPFNGFVSNRFVDNRTRVGIGEPILRLTDLNQLKVLVAFPEALMAELALGASPNDPATAQPKLTAQFAFLPGQAFPLTFAENTGEANPVAQTFTVSFFMQRPATHNILPGMTATVRIESTNPAEQTQLTIPTNALQSATDGNFFVWHFDPATQLVSERSVQVAQLRGGGIGITKGLIAGEIVVAAGASQLREGMQVRPLGELQTNLQP